METDPVALMDLDVEVLSEVLSHLEARWRLAAQQTCITEVLYESCWRLARTTLEHDVCVTSFFQRFWRDGGSLAYWEEYRILKSGKERH